MTPSTLLRLYIWLVTISFWVFFVKTCSNFDWTTVQSTYIDSLYTVSTFLYIDSFSNSWIFTSISLLNNFSLYRPSISLNSHISTGFWQSLEHNLRKMSQNRYSCQWIYYAMFKKIQLYSLFISYFSIISIYRHFPILT